MNLIEKRDFINDRLQQLDESLIIHKKDVLKTKLINRAHKSENDIKSGKIFSRAEIMSFN